MLSYHKSASWLSFLYHDLEKRWDKELNNPINKTGYVHYRHNDFSIA